MPYLALIINWIIRLITLAVIVDVVLSYFVSPLHPVRRFLDRLLQPVLNPIRRLLPATGGADFSPLVLILGLMILNMLLQSILR